MIAPTTAFLISIVLAVAAPPIPGGALTCYTILFVQLKIPMEVMAVTIALNVILEFATTAGICSACRQSWWNWLLVLTCWMQESAERGTEADGFIF